MGKSVYIFNPEHDLALAFGGENYTAPPMAQCLRHDLQMLPVWIADDGACVLSQNADEDNEWLSAVSADFNINVTAVSEGALCDCSNITPWGWDLDVRKRLIAAGAPTGVMPDTVYIDKVRELSHRRISITLHQELRELCHTEFSPLPVELDNFAAIHDFAVAHPCAYVKSPWSSSGKGIFRALDTEAIEFERWCRGILRRQGEMICEEPLNGVLDFAMEFSCVGGKTSFLGYSVFENDFHSSFDHGMVMSTNKLHRLIVDTLGDEALLTTVREALRKIVDKVIAPFYEGYLGVDMLIYLDETGKKRLNPCIELNLRPTMGVVSSVIGNRYVAQSSHGTFKVEYHKEPITQPYLDKLKADAPPRKIKDGKIISGLQMLTPTYSNSRYCAYLTVSED